MVASPEMWTAFEKEVQDLVTKAKLRLLKDPLRVGVTGVEEQWSDISTRRKHV